MSIHENGLEQDEHEKSFFGYSSTEVYYSLKDTATKCIEAFLNECQKTLKENEPGNIDVIEEQIAELKTLYISKSMEVLEGFKGILKDIFWIPPNAAIYGDDKSTFNEQEVLHLRKKAAELELLYLQERLFAESLKQEKQFIDRLKPVMVHGDHMISKLKGDDELQLTKQIDKIAEMHKSCTERLSKNFELDSSCTIITTDFNF